MGIKRLSVEETKDFWFGNDLIAYAFWSGQEVIALPKIEAERGLNYLRKLKSCKTYESAQNLFYNYSQDPIAPKLIPRIIDPILDLETIDELFSKYLLDKGIDIDAQLDYVDQEMGLRNFMDEYYHGDWLPHEYDDNFRELQEHIVWTEAIFTWNEAPPYLDDNETFEACRDVQIWTDSWIPTEIAEAAGSPDDGFGIDYNEAEFLYKNKELFIAEFNKYGIKIVFDHPYLLELIYSS